MSIDTLPDETTLDTESQQDHTHDPERSPTALLDRPDPVPFNPFPSQQNGAIATTGGRDPETGRFLPGHRVSEGTHHLAHHAARLRRELFRAVTREEMGAVIRAMLDKAKAGNMQAAKLILEYTLGSPESLDLVREVATLRGLLLSGVTPAE